MKPEELSERLWKFAARVGKWWTLCQTGTSGATSQGNWFAAEPRLARITTKVARQKAVPTSHTN